MESDNSDSGKEEGEDDTDNEKARLDQMLANHAQYLQMCQTQARLLQALTSYVGAPQEAHIIELESVSDDSDEVTSCSTGESSSQTSNDGTPTPVAEQNAGERVIWAEPIMSCRLVPPPQRGPCRDVRRLPPGVTPEDVKRSKAEAAKAREEARVELNKESENVTHRRLPVDHFNTFMSGAAAANVTNSRTFSSILNLGSIPTAAASAPISAESSLARAQEGFRNVMSQISDASETIKQAHQLLTSMGLGHYSLARRIAQINNNNTDANSAVSANTSDVTTTSVGPLIQTGIGANVKKDPQNSDSSTKDIDGIHTKANNNEDDPTTEANFPPIIVVKPVQEREEKNSEQMESKNALSESKHQQGISSHDTRHTRTAGRSGSLTPNNNTQKYLTRSGIPMNQCRDRNLGLSPTHNSTSLFRWSSHLQNQPVNQTKSMFNHTPNKVVSQYSSCLNPVRSQNNRTLQSTSLAANGGICPIVSQLDLNSSNRKSNTLLDCNITLNTGGETESRINDGNKRHLVTHDEVKRAVELALSNLVKSGKWMNASTVSNKEPLKHSGEDRSKDNKYEIIPEVDTKEDIHDFESKEPNAPNLPIEVAAVNGTLSNQDSKVVKKVVFANEPILIKTSSSGCMDVTTSTKIGDNSSMETSDIAIAQNPQKAKDVSVDVMEATSTANSLSPTLSKSGDELGNKDCPSNGSSLDMPSLVEEMSEYAASQLGDVSVREYTPGDVKHAGGSGDHLEANNTCDKIEEWCDISNEAKAANNSFDIYYSHKDNVFVCAYPFSIQTKHNDVCNEICPIVHLESKDEHILMTREVSSDHVERHNFTPVIQMCAEKEGNDDMKKEEGIACGKSEMLHPINVLKEEVTLCKEGQITNIKSNDDMNIDEVDKVTTQSREVTTHTAKSHKDSVNTCTIEPVDNFLILKYCDDYIDEKLTKSTGCPSNNKTPLGDNADDQQKLVVDQVQTKTDSEATDSTGKVNRSTSQKSKCINNIIIKAGEALVNTNKDSTMLESLLDDGKCSEHEVTNSSDEQTETDTELTLTVSLPDGSVLAKRDTPPRRQYGQSRSTGDMTETQTSGSASERRQLTPLRSVSSQTDTPRHRKNKVGKYFRSMTRKPRSSGRVGPLTKNLLQETRGPNGVECLANTSAFYNKIDGTNDDVYRTFQTTVTRCESIQKIPRRVAPKRDVQKSATTSVSDCSLISVIDLEESKPHEVILPEPSLPQTAEGGKDSPRKTCWENVDPPRGDETVLCKLRSSMSSSGESDDEADYLKNNPPRTRTFWSRTRRLRFRRRRRRRYRHRQGLLARGVQWLRSKLKGPFCKCYKS